MTTKQTQNRWRPKKDFWELKNKLAVESAENKWKLKRGRPKKEKKLDDSINTKLVSKNKEIKVLEKENNEIHQNIWKNAFSSKKIENIEQVENKTEKYSKMLLMFAILFFVASILYKFVFTAKNTDDLKFSEITPLEKIENSASLWAENDTENNMDLVGNDSQSNNFEIQIGNNDENWNFVETERIIISNNETSWDDISTDEIDGSFDNKRENIVSGDIYEEIENEYTALIKLFYEKINAREFWELAGLTDSYLKNSDVFRTYYSSNWLNNFLDKVAGGRIYVVEMKELPSDKSHVKKYWYKIKYKVNWENLLTQEDWEMAIIDRNWNRQIWSIMCTTVWCSKMPFFQK